MTEQPISRITKVILDEASLGGVSAEIEQERKVAMFDLMEANTFALMPRSGREALPGPYHLALSVIERRLVFAVTSLATERADEFHLSFSPLRRVIKDYFAICESYHNAVKQLSASQIEAIDMARRGLHDEGSQLLLERLEGKVKTDFDTARRLFTLVAAIYLSA